MCSPPEREELQHHLVLVQVSMQVMEMLILPLDGPGEVAMGQAHRIQRTNTYLGARAHTHKHNEYLTYTFFPPCEITLQ